MDVSTFAGDNHDQDTQASSRSSASPVVGKIDVKNASAMCERVGTSSRYNLRQKMIPNFLYLSRGSFGNRKKTESIGVKKTDDINAIPEILNVKHELSATDISVIGEPDAIALIEAESKHELDVEMASCFDSQPPELPVTDATNACEENVTLPEVDSQKIDDQTESSKSCLPKFYVENPLKIVQPAVAWVSPLEEVWSKIKYLRFEMPELLDENEENDLVPCLKPVTDMAFYSKRKDSEFVFAYLFCHHNIVQQLVHFFLENNPNE